MEEFLALIVAQLALYLVDTVLRYLAQNITLPTIRR
jgi:hypothetical protein